MRDAAAVAIVLPYAALALGGCSGNVPIESDFPSPVVAALPLNMGILYDDAFRAYSYSEKVPEGGNWTVDLGAANVAMFDRLLAGTFEQVTPVDALPAPPGVDAVIVPSVDEYAFLTPRGSGLDFYSVSIRYVVRLYAPDGAELGVWPINAYGKTRSKLLNPSQSLAEATVMAMRDAAAALSLDFNQRSQLMALLGKEASYDGQGGNR